MNYRDLVDKLGQATADRVVAIWASYLEGLLDHDEAVDLIAVTITAANERATTLADLGLAATLTVATRTPVVPQGLRRPAGDLSRLAKAATTLLGIKDVTEERIARLGRSEALNAAQDARSAGIGQSRLVRGWTRSLSANACQLCRWWWRDGRVWPADVAIQRHKGCSCTQTPVLAEDVKPAPYAGQPRRR